MKARLRHLLSDVLPTVHHFSSSAFFVCCLFYPPLFSHFHSDPSTEKDFSHGGVKVVSELVETGELKHFHIQSNNASLTLRSV